MKAIVPGPNGLELGDVERPAVGDDGILIRVRVASVNAADWHAQRMLARVIGTAIGRKRRSVVAGSDVAGVVEAVGATVTQFAVGDEVFGAAHGAFAEYAVATANRLARKLPSLSFDEAAALPVAGCTAIQGLRKARIRAGERVLIYGAGGGVGTFALQIAKTLGAHVTAATSTAKLQALRALGADATLDYTTEDFTASAARYDVVVDLGGDKSAARIARALTPAGRIVLAGAPNSSIATIARVLTVMRNKNDARRIAYLATLDVADLIELQRLVAERRMTVLIGGRYSLAEVPEAIRAVGARGALGKLIITVA
jgi:NADPH:quinone reductase-like Zn-dependent oxidoreductase